jgi:transcription-repair coupling factor (superfamily II helicase)
MGIKTNFRTTKKFEYHIKPQPSFNKQFDLLLNLTKSFQRLQNYLFCSNDASRFHDIFESLEANSEIFASNTILLMPLYQGFVDEETKLPATDQIFERYHKFSIKMAIRKNKYFKRTDDTFGWDYVTHIDHGIGRFGGVAKKYKSKAKHKKIKLVYADNDIVYVSIHSLHKISKYNGKDGTPPKIYKLGRMLENFKKQNQSTSQTYCLQFDSALRQKKT